MAQDRSTKNEQRDLAEDLRRYVAESDRAAGAVADKAEDAGPSAAAGHVASDVPNPPPLPAAKSGPPTSGTPKSDAVPSSGPTGSDESNPAPVSRGGASRLKLPPARPLTLGTGQPPASEPEAAAGSEAGKQPLHPIDGPAGGRRDPSFNGPATAISSAAPSQVALTHGGLQPLAAAPRAQPTDAPASANEASANEAIANEAGENELSTQRRAARRRAAGPSREQIAANDDAPSIGGLIYALNQKPSAKPFSIATGMSVAWAITTLGFAIYNWGGTALDGGLAAFAGRPEMMMLIATLLGPIGIAFALALIAYRAEEMRLRSSAMTEVAVRLAEPDRMAEQSVASLGQAVRRQVSFMNDAVARALGRAGELEALVHNEVSALERSYEENERKIRGLIHELSGEREALVNTSDRVTGSLKTLGTEVPELIEKLSHQQIKLAKIIEGAGQNLSSLETAIATQTGQLESTLGTRTEHLQTVLSEYTGALSSALDERMETIGSTIAARTGDLQLVFEEYTRALDSTMENRSQTIDGQLAERAKALDSQLALRSQELDSQLVERTRALNDAFSERLRLFDDSIVRSTAAIDSSVGEKTAALSVALETHARTLNDTLSAQSHQLDENLLQGINSVRRTSENITRQSIKAIEGLAGQSELLKNVSENLLSQINGITHRFENQGQQILRSANALESANYKIDQTLQTRHAELSETLDRMVGKADELGTLAHGYSAQLEGTMSQAEQRARLLTSELAQTAEERSRSTIADIERLKEAATDSTSRALDDLRLRFNNVTDEVTQSLGSMTNTFTETTGEARRRTAQATAELASEQDRLRAQSQSLPGTARQSAEAVRKVLQDQLRALDQLSTISQREAGARDVSRPVAPLPLVPVEISPTPAAEQTRALSSLSSALSDQLQTRARAPQAQPAGQQPGAAQQQPSDGRENWSLGDLLKRASADDQPVPAAPAPPGYQQAPQQPQQNAHHNAPKQAPGDGALDVAAAARALDPATAAAIWQRLGAGQRGIMVRSIYTIEGRALFDQSMHRLQTDRAFANSVTQYLSNFEQVLQEAERQDPSGQTAQGHLVSDYGRVYLFLAHLSGRIG